MIKNISIAVLIIAVIFLLKKKPVEKKTNPFKLVKDFKGNPEPANGTEPFTQPNPTPIIPVTNENDLGNFIKGTVKEGATIGSGFINDYVNGKLKG